MSAARVSHTERERAIMANQDVVEKAESRHSDSTANDDESEREYERREENTAEI